MATSSGPSAAPTSNQGTTPEKKRLFLLLGVGGVLALLVGGRFVLGALNKGPAPAATVPTPIASASTTPVTSEEVSAPANGGIPPNGATLTSADGSNPAKLLPLARYRRDPFVPFYLPPGPTPIPPPPPPAPTPTPRPVEVPGPVFLPPVDPSQGAGGAGGAAVLPGFAVPRSNSPTSARQPVVMPQIIIPRVNTRNTTPTDAFPPPRSASGGGAGVTPPSTNKRLSGVVIGNGIRAVLVIDNGDDEPKSYVVQPGDVVEGITVLNIRRFNDSGNQVTRMLIRENGGERYVDLKPGPPRTNTAGGDSRGGTSDPRGGGFDPRGGGGGFDPRGGFGRG